MFLEIYYLDCIFGIFTFLNSNKQIVNKGLIHNKNLFDHILSGQVRFVEQRGVPYRGGRLTSHKATFHNCVPVF